MIYTITLNPAIDYFMDYSKEGEVKKWARTNIAQLQYGGKGINASVLLNNIEVKNKALILTGGSTGVILRTLLDEEGIDYVNFDTKSNTRINVKAQFDDTYELLSNSNNENKDLQEELLNYLKENLKPHDTVMIMGSTMEGLTEWYIDELSEVIKEKEAEVIYDLSGPRILRLLKYKPLVIKPNISELEDIFDVEIKTDEDIKKHARDLLESGVQNVIVSQDVKGAWVFNNTHFYKTNPLKIDLVNGAGAGDSMIAGFSAKLAEGLDIDKALDFANACGAGTASVQRIASKEIIENLHKKVEPNRKEKYA